jgi:hypothetical protein
MQDFAKAIRYSHETLLIDNWFSDFISQHDLDQPIGNEEDIKLLMAVKILQNKDIVSRKLESGTLSQLAKLMRETSVIEEEQEPAQTEKE